MSQAGLLDKGTVQGVGPLGARVMLVGQNPGEAEVREGKPFVGRSGKYLDSVLRKNGIARTNLYITNVVKEKTPRNRAPTADEVNRWMPWLLAEISRVRPRVIVLMGRIAWQVPRQQGVIYIETYHPTAAMRFPSIRARFEADFDRLGRLIGSPLTNTPGQL